MKHFFIVFSIVFLCCVLAISAGLVVYYKLTAPINPDENLGEDIVPIEDKNDTDNNDSTEQNNEDDANKTPLEKAFEESKRINFLLLGLEEVRSDTIIFASFDPKNKKLDMISIPRDTYYLRQGNAYKAADERKINAVYGDHGTNGVKTVVSNILYGVPIHNYVRVDYKGVERIVDILDGVEVDVPLNMKYDDPYDDPPLHIDIPKGRQVLDGENAVKFLRYRSGYHNGDLDRVKAQQQFIKSAIKKSMSLKIASVVKTAINYVKTDVSIADALILAADASKLDLNEDISMITMHGSTERRTFGGVTLDYFIYDVEKTKELIMDLYGVEEEINE